MLSQTGLTDIDPLINAIFTSCISVSEHASDTGQPNLPRVPACRINHAQLCLGLGGAATCYLLLLQVLAQLTLL